MQVRRVRSDLGSGKALPTHISRCRKIRDLRLPQWEGELRRLTRRGFGGFLRQPLQPGEQLRTLDLSEVSYERIMRNRPFLEQAVI